MKIISYIIACIFLSAPVLYSQTSQEMDSPQNFILKLTEQGAATKTITCNFLQTKRMAVFSEDIISKGRFYYCDGQISLEYTEPSGEVIVMGSDKFKVVANGRKTIIPISRSKALGLMKEIFTACIKGEIKQLEKDFKMEYFENSKYSIVHIIPESKKLKSMMGLVTLTFDKKDMSLHKLKMEESSGDYTEYEFSNKKFNVELDESKFEI